MQLQKSSKNLQKCIVKFGPFFLEVIGQRKFYIVASAENLYYSIQIACLAVFQTWFTLSTSIMLIQVNDHQTCYG